MFMPPLHRRPSMPSGIYERFIFDPPPRPAAPHGGLLDPVVPPGPPALGGLLDAAGRQGLQEDRRPRSAQQVKRTELPEILRDVPLGPEGGLIGYMLAQYVEPDRDGSELPQVDESERPNASARIEARPDGSVWKIDGPARTMIRPPDSELALYETQPDYPPSTEVPSKLEMRALAAAFQFMVASGRVAGYDFAAGNLEHFLKGRGAPRFYDPDWLRSYPLFKGAERRVQRHFEEWLTGDLIPENPEEHVKDDLLHLREGDSFSRSSSWDGNINRWDEGIKEGVEEQLSVADLYAANPLSSPWSSIDSFLAAGNSTIKGTGDFTFRGEGDRIRFDGRVTHRWRDPYDWAKDGYYGGAVKLQDHGEAKPFMMESEWVRSVKGTLRKDGDRLALESIEWSD